MQERGPVRSADTLARIMREKGFEFVHQVGGGWWRWVALVAAAEGGGGNSAPLGWQHLDCPTPRRSSSWPAEQALVGAL